MGESFFERCGAILWVSDEERRFLEVNPGAVRLFGKPAAELVGSSVSSCFLEKDRALVREMLEFAARGEAGEAPCLGRALQCAQDQGSLVIDSLVAHGRKTYAVARQVSSDRAVLRASGEMRRVLDPIDRVERVLCADIVLREVVHELRQPLSVVANNAAAASRFLQKGAAHTAKAEKAAQLAATTAVSAGEALGRVAESLGSRLPRGTRVDAGLVIRDLVESEKLAAFVAAGVLGTDIEPALGAIAGDPTLVALAIREVILNALESVSLRTDDAREDVFGGVTVAAAQCGETGMVEISVSDNGNGVAAGTMESLVKPFISGREGAAGLGLAIAQRVVRLHQGELTLEHNAGRGSVVRMRLGDARLYQE